jgi:hypothetical protein
VLILINKVTSAELKFDIFRPIYLGFNLNSFEISFKLLSYYFFKFWFISSIENPKNESENYFKI